jgi:hypothetical protein
MNITVVVPIRHLITIVDTSNILERLDREANVNLLLPFPVTNPIERTFDQYRESRIGRIFRDIVLNSHTMLKSAQVKSFETRIRITLGLHLNFFGDYRLNMRELISKLNKPRTLLTYMVFVVSKSKLMASLFKMCSLIWPSFIRALLKSKPDIVVIFSGGAFTGVENVCLKICEILKIPTVLIVDNWDNLSSKSLFWSCPTGLGVWGKNMENDAKLIHGMQPKVLKHIGSARFRPNEHTLIPIEQEFLLFAGSGKPLINELDAVFKVRELMNNCGLSCMELIYRPHPMSEMNMDKIKELLKSKSNIQIDPSFRDDLTENFYQHETLRYLESLCKYARLVIAPQSTIIVESLSLGTPVISLNWADAYNRERPLDEYTHLLELNSTIGYFAPQSFIELRHAIIEAMQLDFEYNLVPEILPTFDDNYSDRILSLVNETYFKFGDPN